MLKLFAPKKPDFTAMEAFWRWFEENDLWIQQNAKTNGIEVVNHVDQVLCPIFPYFDRNKIEFQLGFNEGAGEFFFFDLNNKNLARDAAMLAEKMPESLRDHWNFIIEH